ncbi:uncharacterized protein LOC121420978 [Lytechinus variegatus]|uniref:uncharacterized protein LOC121420978 n=1 Tax=Lytechinus variegatus TaxID=7654 RepID=UPI001BB1F5F6|nr:uncharacterized protein LOC121420978 [Lytechinus variegatus]
MRMWNNGRPLDMKEFDTSSTLFLSTPSSTSLSPSKSSSPSPWLSSSSSTTFSGSLAEKHTEFSTTAIITSDASSHDLGRPGIIALIVLYVLLAIAVSLGVIAACCFRRRVFKAEVQSRLSRASSTQRSSISRLNSVIYDEQASNSGRKNSTTPNSHSSRRSQGQEGDRVYSVTEDGFLAVPKN